MSAFLTVYASNLPFTNLFDKAKFSRNNALFPSTLEQTTAAIIKQRWMFNSWQPKATVTVVKDFIFKMFC